MKGTGREHSDGWSQFHKMFICIFPESNESSSNLRRSGHSILWWDYSEALCVLALFGFADSSFKQYAGSEIAVRPAGLNTRKKPLRVSLRAVEWRAD